MSSWLLLFGLGVAWAVVLVPDLVRRNVASRRSDTIGQFARNLSSLERSAPVGVNRSNLVQFPNRMAERTGQPVQARARQAAPARRSGPRTAMQQRRKDVLAALVAAALLSFLGSVSMGGALVMVNAIVDAALLLYVVALTLVTRREKLRAQVGVLYTPPSQFSGVAPAYIERQRVAAGGSRY